MNEKKRGNLRPESGPCSHSNPILFPSANNLLGGNCVLQKPRAKTCCLCSCSESMTSAVFQWAGGRLPQRMLSLPSRLLLSQPDHTKIPGYTGPGQPLMSVPRLWEGVSVHLVTVVSLFCQQFKHLGWSYSKCLDTLVSRVWSWASRSSSSPSGAAFPWPCLCPLQQGEVKTIWYCIIRLSGIH